MQKQRANRITSLHKVKHNSDRIHECANSVRKLKLWVICCSICYLIVWGHWPKHLPLSSTQHAAPLLRMHQQWQNEAIPDRKNPVGLSPSQQKVKKWQCTVHAERRFTSKRRAVRRWWCASNAWSGFTMLVWWKQSQNSTGIQGTEPSGAVPTLNRNWIRNS